jgi:hypothetical protein
MSAEKIDANARLIAAAPVMLEEFKTLLHLAETPGDFTEAERLNVLADASGLLAEIEGRS